MNRKYWLIGLVAAVGILSAACTEADVASSNLSTAADQFKVTRRIIFINGITDKHLLYLEGRCALGNFDKGGELSVTCKTGENSYKKHFLGLSDNVSYVAEQLEPMAVDTYHYKVIWSPSTIIPDIDIR